MQTAAQPNITSVGSLTSLDVTNNITVGGTVDGRDISADGLTLDNLNTTIGLSGLTTAEVNQLKNIGLTTISTTQWGYLGNLNQDLTTASNVTFNNVTGTLQTASQPNITSVGSLTSLDVTNNITVGGTVDGRYVSADGLTLDNLNTTIGLSGLTTAEVNQLKNIGLTTISTTQWGYLGDLNQDLTTASNVTFNNVTGTLQTASQPKYYICW